MAEAAQQHDYKTVAWSFTGSVGKEFMAVGRLVANFIRVSKASGELQSMALDETQLRHYILDRAEKTGEIDRYEIAQATNALQALQLRQKKSQNR